VELHESQHEYLALVNVTDGIGRLYGQIYEKAKEELTEEHRRLIGELLRVINQNTVYTHELVATYTSCQLFALWMPENISVARAELTKFYKDVLSDGEQAFGPISRDHNGAVNTAVIAFAIAAMNIPYPADIIRFDRLRDCIRLIQSTSPDRRLRWLLKRTKPAWEPKSLLYGLDVPYGKGAGEEELSIAQAWIFDRIRSAFPSFEFFTQSERPSILRDWLALLVDDARQYGYQFLKGAEVLPYPGEDPVERTSVQLDLPGVESGILDLSLVQLRYTEGSLNTLASAAHWCAEGDRRLLIHVFVHDDEAGLACFAIGPDAEMHPFFVSCDFGDLLRLLADLPKATLVLKIDERLGKAAASRLSVTGHSVFVLVSDTTTPHVHALIQESAADQRVYLGALTLRPDDDSFVILYAYLDRDRYTLLCPITKLGIFLLTSSGTLRDNENLVSIPEGALSRMLPFLADESMRPAHLSALMTTCYVGIT
jgi:hypothetical protein